MYAILKYFISVLKFELTVVCDKGICNGVQCNTECKTEGLMLTILMLNYMRVTRGAISCDMSKDLWPVSAVLNFWKCIQECTSLFFINLLAYLVL
jgi:hypothetical protein